MQHFIASLPGVLSNHPTLAVLAAFVLAASESIIVIGAFVPGTALLLALSAMIGLGHLPLWPIMIAATLGAVAGDGLSYWIGHRHRAQITAMWPFSRWPGLLTKGQAFFDRHGGKGVLAARFTPGVRAVLPVIAGSSGMAPGRFFAANIGSAVIWAPAHILPGAAAGLGLGIAGQSSLRLAGLALLLLLAVVAAILALRLVFGWVLPLVDRLRLRLADRLRAGAPTPMRRALLALVDPGDNLRPLLLIALPLALMVIGLAMLTAEVAERGGLAAADAAISHALTGLRTDPGDDVMVFLTSFGDWPVITAATATMALWLIARGGARLGLGLAITMILSSGIASALKVTLAVPRPAEVYAGVQSFSFPSGHATGAMTLFGLLAWFAWRGLPRFPARLLTGLFAAIATIIAVSRLYLGVHWPSDVAGGLMLGAVLVLSFAMAFRGSAAAHAGAGLALTLAVFAGFGTAYSLRTMPKAMERYARVTPAPVDMTKAAWLAGGWRDLPQARRDLAGEAEQPLILQWAGTPEALQARLAPQGWIAAPPLTLASLPRYVTATDPAALPVIPRLEDGRRPVLALIRPTQDGREVLFAWPSGATADGTPILVAATDYELVTHPLSFLTVSDARDLPPAPVLDGADMVLTDRTPPLSLGPR